MTPFQTALVTGASSGLGRAIALELARRGTRRLVLASRRREELEALAAELSAAGAEPHVVVLDVRDTARVAEVVRALDAELGGFDLVLANAGVGGAGPATELELATLLTTLEVNVLGAVATLWAATGPMVARGRGTLAGMSSLAALRGYPRSGAYAASKAALSTWLETLRSDLADTGVRVVDVRPGFVRTPMTDDNDFEMPFLMEVEDAARRCVRDLERGRAISAWPAPLAWLLWGMHRVPDVAWRVIARWVRKRSLRAEVRGSRS